MRHAVDRKERRSAAKSLKGYNHRTGVPEGIRKFDSIAFMKILLGV